MSKPSIDSIGTEWATGPESRTTDAPHPAWEAREVPQPPGAPDKPTRAFQPLLFRFVLLYMGIQLLPIDGRFFRNLLSFEGDSTAYAFTRYLFNLSKFAPRFFGPVDTFANWGVVALLAGLGAVIWTVGRRGPAHRFDQTVYNWLRVAVRYRLALAVIAYGFLKLFAIQAPLPSLSNLNTAYGDHSAWKLFSLSLGVVPGYQSFLGGVELLGGLLLLHRKTTVLGTLVLLPFLGNVFFSNLAYEGGEYVYSGLLLTFGLFLFGHDAGRLFRLVSLEAPTQPDRFTLALTPAQQTARYVLKGAFVLLAVGLYGFTTATTGPVRLPQTAGLAGLAGIYRVSEYQVDGHLIPYSKTARSGLPATRWQDVVFETWNTISVRSNEPVRIHHVTTEELPADDAQRDYELAGSQGRHYYRYTTDAASRVLRLQKRYADPANPNHANDRLTLTLNRLGNDQLVLSGTDAAGRTIKATLVKIPKKYLQHEAAKAGRRGSLTL